MIPCVCPTCGQRMLTHYGERFTIQQSDILQMIEGITKRHGGIMMDTLITCFVPNTPRRIASQRIRSVITVINEKLVSTDFRIVGPGIGKGDGLWKFVNTATRSSK